MAQILAFPVGCGAAAAAEQEADTTALRGLMLALASLDCPRCNGSGMKNATEGCPCALRAVTRIVMRRFHHDRKSAAFLRNHGRGWDLPVIDFCADVLHVAQETLDAEHFRVFELAHVDKVDWRFGTRITGLSKGNYFHTLYRAEATAGRAFIDTKPFALYPIADYYSNDRIGAFEVASQHATPWESSPASLHQHFPYARVA